MMSSEPFSTVSLLNKELPQKYVVGLLSPQHIPYCTSALITENLILETIFQPGMEPVR